MHYSLLDLLIDRSADHIRFFGLCLRVRLSFSIPIKWISFWLRIAAVYRVNYCLWWMPNWRHLPLTSITWYFLKGWPVSRFQRINSPLYVPVASSCGSFVAHRMSSVWLVQFFLHISDSKAASSVTCLFQPQHKIRLSYHTTFVISLQKKI